MENPIRKLSKIVENITNPLPRPEIEENKFLEGLSHLSQKEIREVLRIVIDETRKSRKFGLFLDPQLLEKEEGFFLVGLDTFGGIDNIVGNCKLEEISKVMSDIGDKFFEKEREEFHKKFKEAKDGGSANRYNLHLESTKNMILHGVYNSNSSLRR
ncbi:MAG: hypothetical protein UX13_C0042G0008 [Candidatus Woesebacteria bacterium GW2011_GWB1_45_5]|uniref:Uncharacterized protein n=1 Tax=Candidatus Woesebacteria bacterium GW2011_GWB1_45_5 TaxID=1618581 RepID=A0A0G1MMN0_9BACT|nr:MAG: hypothetical protein UX13_C0042G0008 [Candidatus Woesebacteria bacterium GW2011_GWB1_45_5]